MIWKMMASIALATAALSATVTIPAMAQDAPAKAPPTTADFVQAMQHLVGTPDESGFMLQSVTAEGDMMVFVFVGPDGWRDGVDAEQITNALVQGFCKDGSVYFSLGLTMRVDSIDRNVRLKGPVVSACPTQAG